MKSNLRDEIGYAVMDAVNEDFSEYSSARLRATLEDGGMGEEELECLLNETKLLFVSHSLHGCLPENSAGCAYFADDPVGNAKEAFIEEAVAIADEGHDVEAELRPLPAEMFEDDFSWDMPHDLVVEMRWDSALNALNEASFDWGACARNDPKPS